MKHLFVINPRSFPVQATQDRVVKEIHDCFVDLGGGEYTILLSRYSRDAIGLIRTWLKEHQGNETVRVYAVGGDGILFDCLNGIVGLPNTELAAIPYGSANDYIRAFGEDKKENFRNIKLQVCAQTIPADIIHCGNNYAMNFCTVGIESEAIMFAVRLNNNLPQNIRKYQRLSSLIYVMLLILGGTMAVFNKKILYQHYTISIDGEDFSGAYGTINIANGPCYGGDKNPVTTAMPDDGILDALFFKCGSSLKAASVIPKYVKGAFRDYPNNFFLRRFKKIEIRSESPLLVDLDGEVFFDTNLTVQIIPSAIKFAAPGGIAFLKMADTNE
ncbi:MAG: hypothetical protein FWH19_03490 [Treponema sp.]|nr:hypothetical protein [Treponema sp.]